MFYPWWSRRNDSLIIRHWNSNHSCRVSESELSRNLFGTRGSFKCVFSWRKPASFGVTGLIHQLLLFTGESVLVANEEKVLAQMHLQERNERFAWNETLDTDIAQHSLCVLSTAHPEKALHSRGCCRSCSIVGKPTRSVVFSHLPVVSVGLSNVSFSFFLFLLFLAMLHDWETFKKIHSSPVF